MDDIDLTANIKGKVIKNCPVDKLHFTFFMIFYFTILPHGGLF